MISEFHDKSIFSFLSAGELSYRGFMNNMCMCGFVCEGICIAHVWRPEGDKRVSFCHPHWFWGRVSFNLPLCCNFYPGRYSHLHLPQCGEIVVTCHGFCHSKVAEERNTRCICAAIMKISVIKFQKSKSRYIIWPDYTSIPPPSKGFVIYPLDTCCF